MLQSTLLTRRTLSITLAIFLLSICGTNLFAQENTKINNILQRFKNWRYGNISLFRANDATVEQLNLLLSPKQPPLTELANRCTKKTEIQDVIDVGDDPGAPENKGLINSAECKAYAQYYALYKDWERGLFRKAYIVTTRMVGGQTPTIIALLTSKNKEGGALIQDDIDPPNNIYTANQLQRSAAPATSNAATLYDYLATQIIQGNVENVTLEAQGIGDPSIRWVAPAYGTSTLINEDSIQTIIRITEGQPMLYTGRHEVIASLFDLLSYRYYDTPSIDEDIAAAAAANNTASNPAPGDTTNPGAAASAPAETGVVYNKSLPKFGLELRYGLEDINYPSVWSNRLALNAIWGSSRLGVILPTEGWASISNQIGAPRKLTTAGFGINGNFDFPIKIIAQSGLFSFSGSYVFDKADSSDHPVRINNPFGNPIDRDFLVRFHTTAHYSFAINVDQNHFFRFKLGGTVYGIEGWNSVLDTATSNTNFEKTYSETIGGISGRIEYMAVNNSTPYGFGLQYFDEAILADLWLQVPFTNSFAVRFDAKGFAPIFREARVWENKTVFIPTARFILNF